MVVAVIVVVFFKPTLMMRRGLAGSNWKWQMKQVFVCLKTKTKRK